jgi:hypothetical protein
LRIRIVCFMKSCGLWRMAIMRVGCMAIMRVGCIERALVALNIFAVFGSSQLMGRVESRRIAVGALASSHAGDGSSRNFPRLPSRQFRSAHLNLTFVTTWTTTTTCHCHHTTPTTPQTTANMSDNENGENGDELVTKPFKFVTGELFPRLRVYGIDS